MPQRCRDAGGGTLSGSLRPSQGTALDTGSSRYLDARHAAIGAPGHSLPPAFRVTTLPDGSANSCSSAPAGRPSDAATRCLPSSSMPRRRSGRRCSPRRALVDRPVSAGREPGGLTRDRLSGRSTHPHGPVHIHVGGPSGLMTDPNTATSTHSDPPPVVPGPESGEGAAAGDQRAWCLPAVAATRGLVCFVAPPPPNHRPLPFRVVSYACEIGSPRDTIGETSRGRTSRGGLTLQARSRMADPVW